MQLSVLNEPGRSVPRSHLRRQLPPAPASTLSKAKVRSPFKEIAGVAQGPRYSATRRYAAEAAAAPPIDRDGGHA